MESTDWSKEEFIAYLLLYAARAHYLETSQEKEIIHSKLIQESYKKIFRELEKDNDFQSLEKILSNVKKYNYTKSNVDLLIREIKMLFLMDGDCSAMERSMFVGLKRLLKDRN